MSVIVRADFRRDGKAWRHRQTQARHFGEPRALAAQQVAHVGANIGLASSKGINPSGIMGSWIGHRTSPSIDGKRRNHEPGGRYKPPFWAKVIGRNSHKGASLRDKLAQPIFAPLWRI